MGYALLQTTRLEVAAMKKSQKSQHFVRYATTRRVLAVTLAWLLIVMSTLMNAPDARAAAPKTSVKGPNIQAQVLEIPVGSVVQVQLESKEKLRGQLGNVTNEGFSVKTAKNGTVTDVRISFGDVKSISQARKGHSPAFWVLIGVGAVFAVCGVIAAAISGGQ